MQTDRPREIIGGETQNQDKVRRHPWKEGRETSSSWTPWRNMLTGEGKNEFWSKRMFRKFIPSKRSFIHKVGTKTIWGEWEKWGQEKFGLETSGKRLPGRSEGQGQRMTPRHGLRGLWDCEREERANPALQQKRTEWANDSIARPRNTMLQPIKETHLFTYEHQKAFPTLWDKQNQVKIQIFAKSDKCTYLYNQKSGKS